MPTTHGHSASYSVDRQGLRFERSGNSMAVYDGPLRIDRITIEPTEEAFLRAIDGWIEMVDPAVSREDCAEKDVILAEKTA